MANFGAAKQQVGRILWGAKISEKSSPPTTAPRSASSTSAPDSFTRPDSISLTQIGVVTRLIYLWTGPSFASTYPQQANIPPFWMASPQSGIANYALAEFRLRYHQQPTRSTRDVRQSDFDSPYP